MLHFVSRSLIPLAIAVAVVGCGGSSSLDDSQSTKASLAPTPALRAAMELGSAKTLEKSRKTKQALTAYRRIVEVYPESPQAKIAAERITAMGSK